jgi:hypothetical protein
MQSPNGAGLYHRSRIEQAIRQPMGRRSAALVFLARNNPANQHYSDWYVPMRGVRLSRILRTP